MQAGPGATRLPRGAGFRTKGVQCVLLRHGRAGQGFRPGTRGKATPLGEPVPVRKSRLKRQHHSARGHKQTGEQKVPEADSQPPCEGLGGKGAGHQGLSPSQNPLKALPSPESRTLHHSHTNGHHSVATSAPSMSQRHQHTHHHHARKETQDATLRQASRIVTQTGKHTGAPVDPAVCPTATALPALGAGSRRSAGSNLLGGAGAGGGPQSCLGD